jgi:hypothetical protein
VEIVTLLEQRLRQHERMAPASSVRTSLVRLAAWIPEKIFVNECAMRPLKSGAGRTLHAAKMPEPTTVATRSAVPKASAATEDFFPRKSCVCAIVSL